jgi:m7GpppX diphosphatase
MEETTMIRQSLADFVFEKVLSSDIEQKSIYVQGHLMADGPEKKVLLKLVKEAFDEQAI